MTTSRSDRHRASATGVAIAALWLLASGAPCWAESAPDDFDDSEVLASTTCSIADEPKLLVLTRREVPVPDNHPSLILKALEIHRLDLDQDLSAGHPETVVWRDAHSSHRNLSHLMARHDFDLETADSGRVFLLVAVSSDRHLGLRLYEIDPERATATPPPRFDRNGKLQIVPDELEEPLLAETTVSLPIGGDCLIGRASLAVIRDAFVVHAERPGTRCYDFSVRYEPDGDRWSGITFIEAEMP